MGKGIINYDAATTNELLNYVKEIKDGGGINLDAPKDGNLYGQQDGEWKQAQEKLVDGESIKTLNGVSVLGSGNIDVAPTIGDNGNWYINGEDTGKPSKGTDGKNGADGVSLGEIALVQETGTENGSENKVMSQKAISTELIKRTTELNISALYPTSGIDGSNRYDLAGAIAQVPTQYRSIVGLKITFINNSTDKTETWKYDGGTFTSTASWKQGDGSGGNKILIWNTDAATTRKQVPIQDRHEGMTISYKNNNGEWINEQYIGTLFIDTEWEKNRYWAVPSDDRIIRELITSQNSTFNLFNSSILTNNGAINFNSGKNVDGDYGFYSDFVEANGFVDYIGDIYDYEGQTTLSDYLATIAAFYDESKVFIKSSIRRNDFCLNAKYIRFYCTTKYKEVFSVKTCRYPEDINNYKKINLVEQAYIIEGSFVSKDGKIVTYSGTVRTDFIYTANKISKLYWDSPSNQSFQNIAAVSFWNENKTFIGFTQDVSNEIDIPQGCYYIIFSNWSVQGLTAVYSFLSEYLISLDNKIDKDISEDIVAIPKYVDYVKGRVTNIYLDGVIGEIDSEMPKYLLKGSFGLSSLQYYDNRLLSIPESFNIDMSELSLKKQGSDKIFPFTLRGISKAGDGAIVNILLAGDSLVASGYGVKEMYDLLDSDGDYIINQIGTKTQGGAKHEGIAFKKWIDFIGTESPFYFNGKLDFKEYMLRNFPDLDKIDILIIALGTNDLPLQGTSIDDDPNFANDVNVVIEYAKTFVDAFFSEETGYPDAKMAIGLLTPFAANMPYNYKVAAAKRNTVYLNKRYIKTFDNGVYHPNLTTIMHGAYVDRFNNYNKVLKNPDDLSSNEYNVCSDFIHPNENGYKQMGRAYYNKVRAFLSGVL